MPATDQDIKDFFALTGNNPNFTNTRLAKVTDWLKATTGKDSVDADDVVDYLFDELRAKVTHWLQDTAQVTF